MKKFAITIIIFAAIGFFSYPYVQHRWFIYQLHKKGVELNSPMTGDAETVRKLEEQNFVNAACSPNPDVLPLLLKTRFNVNSKREDGMTALHCAAADGKLQQARLLLDRGAKVSARSNATNSSPGLTPIHMAAAWHHMDVVELLKSRGANINEPSEAGPPLMVALTVIRRERFSPRNGSLHTESDLFAIYQTFMKLGADLGVVDDEGNTLLHVAMFSHQRPLIEAMVESGSFNLNQPNNAGDTPFMILVRNAQYKTSSDGRTGVTNDLDLFSQMIAKGANVNARNKNGYAVIQSTAFKPDLFDLLVKQGADVLVADNIGNSIWSELQYQPPYIVIGFADKLTTLLTPKMVDGKSGNGPLHVFARQLNHQLVEYFLKRGMSPNERNNELNTPLHMALSALDSSSKVIGLELSVKALLDAGADPNARNQFDETPLMFSGRHSVLIVKMLLAKKADVNAVAKAGEQSKHVLDYFSEKRNLQGFDLLVKAGASKNR